MALACPIGHVQTLQNIGKTHIKTDSDLITKITRSPLMPATKFYLEKLSFSIPQYLLTIELLVSVHIEVLN